MFCLSTVFRQSELTKTDDRNCSNQRATQKKRRCLSQSCRTSARRAGDCGVGVGRACGRRTRAGAPESTDKQEFRFVCAFVSQVKSSTEQQTLSTRQGPPYVSSASRQHVLVARMRSRSATSAASGHRLCVCGVSV